MGNKIYHSNRLIILDINDKEDLKSPVNKLRLCINAIRRSTKLLEELKNLCRVSVEEYHEPTNDCPTRWSSTHAMINTAIRQKKAMTMLMANSDTAHVKDALNANDWTALESILPTLAVFAKATKVFSLQNYPNIHIADEIFSGLIKFLAREQDDFKKVMSLKLREYSEKLPKERWIAEALNPNCKIDGGNALAMRKLEIFEAYAEDYGSLYRKLNKPNVILAPTTPRKHRKTPMEEFLELIEESDGEQCISEVDAQAEIRRYLAGSKAGSNVDPCSWWRTNEAEYPVLAIMARDWLAVPASSVPCEQLFSLAGNTITKNRNSLSPDTARSLLCLKSWWAYESNI